jgi:hypothetical protein
MTLIILIFIIVFIMLVVPYTYLNKDMFLLKIWGWSLCIATGIWLGLVVGGAR